MLSPRELLAQAKAKGLIVQSAGVNLQALGASFGAEVPGLRLLEKDWQKQLIQVLRLGGWRIAHFRPARVLRRGKETYETPIAEDGKGFLDLEAVRERLVKIEAKVHPNKTTPEQDAWLEAYRRAGVECYVWYPEDLPTVIEVMACPPRKPRRRKRS